MVGQIKILVISNEIEICQTSILTILHENFGINKVSVLTLDQKLCRQIIFEENLTDLTDGQNGNDEK